MSKGSQSSSFGQAIWNFFSSVKLSFSLLLILALTSIAGTLIPQKEAASVYLRAFGEAGWRLVQALGLNDMYHAAWFRLILAALAVNLVICSLNRLPTTFKLMRRDPEEDLASMRKPRQRFTLPGAPSENLAAAEKALTRVGRVQQGQTPQGLVLFAQKGAWSRLGVYVVHLSVLVILAGALVGNFLGFAGSVNIEQGQTVDHIILDSRQPKKLDFALRLNKFTISYYPSGMPSEYRSEVTFLKNGQPVKSASLIVNDPAEFQGIDFYQASYGESLNLKVSYQKGDKTLEAVLSNQHWRQLPDGAYAAVADYRKSIKMGDKYSGPFARIVYQGQQGESQSFNAFKPGAGMPSAGPISFAILGASSVPYSGLQVKYDPGVWFIWVGCTLMVIGFFMAFYFAHRKVWVRLSPTEQGRTRVELAGGTNKNRPGLTRLLARLGAELGGREQQAE
ncbi:MAG: cytochrome c biogenesis protein ResB [Thermodesulfobacteriota bacterium]